MIDIQNFIRETLENHICNVEHETYKKLENLLDKKLLLELSTYLENSQDTKFEERVNELLEESKLKQKLLLLMQGQIKVTPISKSVSFKNDTKLCTIFYGTNREPHDKDDHTQGYSNERAEEIYYGSCEVIVPRSRHTGEIKSSFWNKLVKFDYAHTDLELIHTLHSNENIFWQNIHTLLNPLEIEEQEAIIFIHGYNTSFQKAAIRTAQISLDLSHKGITAFFSWPSKGTLLGYLSDEASIQYSEKYIKEFLTDFVKKSGAKKVHIIAHSMGNRALLHALHRMKEEKVKVAFGQIILAAPDVDADVFQEFAHNYKYFSEQTTLYTSSSDKAVGASKWVHSHARVGFTPPISVIPNIHTIKVETEVDIFELGHKYFAQHELLLADMDTLLDSNSLPSQREALKETFTDEPLKLRYWKLQE